LQHYRLGEGVIPHRREFSDTAGLPTPRDQRAATLTEWISNFLFPLRSPSSLAADSDNSITNLFIATENHRPFFLVLQGTQGQRRRAFRGYFLVFSRAHPRPPQIRFSARTGIALRPIAPLGAALARSELRSSARALTRVRASLFRYFHQRPGRREGGKGVTPRPLRISEQRSALSNGRV